jgi:hypothetical protein
MISLCLRGSGGEVDELQVNATVSVDVAAARRVVRDRQLVLGHEAVDEESRADVLGEVRRFGTLTDENRNPGGGLAPSEFVDSTARTGPWR